MRDRMPLLFAVMFLYCGAMMAHLASDYTDWAFPCFGAGCFSGAAAVGNVWMYFWGKAVTRKTGT